MMTNGYTVTVDHNIVIQVMNRLRAEGWRKVLGVHPDGRVYSLVTQNGELRPEEDYDQAFLASYESEYFKRRPVQI